MRTISSCFFTFLLITAFTPRIHAQDSATQQQLDKLSGDIQDIEGQLSQQNKRIEDLEKKVSDMQDKLSTPAANNSANADDLKKLAEQVQEIDRKRQADNEQILKALEKLSKGGNAGIESHESHRSAETAPANAETSQTPAAGGAGGQQNGYYYTIQSGNTLSAIAKAYQAKGIKVTVKEILAANPGLNPGSLYVGQKIFIPAQ